MFLELAEAGTTIMFRNVLGLSEAKWEEKEEGQEPHQEQEQYPAHDSNQRTLSGFLESPKSSHK
jgi:hypothetical protein